MPEMSAAARAFCSAVPYQLFARRVVLPWALQGLRPAGEALEIGSGTGAMAAQLLATHGQLRVVATDYDPEMVAVARKTLEDFGERAAVQQVDATKLPFEDSRFDLVLSFAMLHHVLDWEKATAEAVRVLRPGGRLVGYDMLDSLPFRLMHHGEHETRLMRRGQFEEQLGRLPLADVRTRPSLGGLVARFMATKMP